MARDLDPFKLSSPRIFLFRMLVFLILCGLVLFVLHKQIVTAFMANPGLNALIIAVLFIGILLAFRQVEILSQACTLEPGDVIAGNETLHRQVLDLLKAA